MPKSEAELIKELAQRDLYKTVFDVWVSSGRDLKYTQGLWEYFDVVVSPIMIEHTPSQEECAPTMKAALF